jgi:hypothetical protein
MRAELATSATDTSLAISAGRGRLALRVLWQLWWVSVPLWSLGFGALAPSAWRLIANRRWRDAYAVAGYLAALAAQVSLLAVSSHGRNVFHLMRTFLFISVGVVGKLGAMGASIGIVSAYVGSVHALVVFRPSAGFRGAALYRPLETRDSAVLRAARHRVRRRRAARRLARRHPGRAGQLSIGRPDLQQSYDDGGLVDINHVPDLALAEQLGMAQQEIDALHAARQHLGSFTSAAELSIYAKLPAHRVAELRDFIICL